MATEEAVRAAAAAAAAAVTHMTNGDDLFLATIQLHAGDATPLPTPLPSKRDENAVRPRMAPSEVRLAVKKDSGVIVTALSETNRVWSPPTQRDFKDDTASSQQLTLIEQGSCVKSCFLFGQSTAQTFV